MITLPTLVFARDYHEFSFMEDAYKQIGLKVKVEELGLDYDRGDYVGLVFKGRAPAKAKIDALVKKFQVEFMD
jgi:hypothetical protein